MITLNKQSFVLITIVWILAWLLPWNNWLKIDANLVTLTLSDLLRLSLALALFIMPGTFLYLLLNKRTPSNAFSLALIPIGFTFSTLLIALIGLLGRTTGLSFEAVKYIFALTGWIAMLILLHSWKNETIHLTDITRYLNKSLKNKPLLAAILIAMLMLLNGSLFFVDDWTYLAYITNWQYSPSLDFKEVIFGTDAIDPVRFWLSLYPMGQALISNLSGVAGILLLGSYLEFFLIVIAILSMYYFARELGLGQQTAGLAVLAQVSLYTWIIGGLHNPAGMWFYQSMSSDKVSATYILAPVLFTFTLRYFSQPSNKTLPPFFLVGWSVALTHPIILFFTALILTGMAIIFFLLRKISLKALIIVGIMIIVWMSPYIYIRLSDHESFQSVAFSAQQNVILNRYITISPDGNYIIKPDSIKFIDIPIPDKINFIYQLYRSLPLIFLFAAGILGLFYIKKSPLYVYLFVMCALVAMALIPSTAQIFFYFVSVRLAYRILWFAPLGLSVMALAHLAWHNRGHSKISRTRAIFGGTVLLLIFGLVSPGILSLRYGFPEAIRAHIKYQELADIGKYIHKNHSENIAIISLNENDNFIPGLAPNAIPISFREKEPLLEVKYFFTQEELIFRERDSDVIQSFSNTISAETRLHYLEKYTVRYIIADIYQLEVYTSILNHKHKFIRPVYKTAQFVLLEVIQEREKLP